MGYRQYFYEIDKTIVDEIRKCKTKEDLYNVFLKNNIECEKRDKEDGKIHYHCPLYNLNKEIFEFGKGYENSEEIYKHGDSLFTSVELNEKYEDERPIVCDESAILCAIEWNKKHIIDMYEHLINNTFEKSFERYNFSKEIDEKELHYQRLLSHCRDHLRWWKPEFGDYTAINLDKEKDMLVESWLYEHQIFDLVRIYKTFDWENKCLLFFGW